jgi:hypothetical protein
MSRTISQRELRNGVPVGELTRMRRHRFVAADAEPPTTPGRTRRGCVFGGGPQRPGGRQRRGEHDRVGGGDLDLHNDASAGRRFGDRGRLSTRAVAGGMPSDAPYAQLLGHDLDMDDRRRLASLALSLIKCAENGDEHADALLAEALGTHETAARAHAYLSGFILRVLAAERDESVEQAASRIRQLLVDR